MVYSCYKCRKEVKEEERFIANYGEVLCSKCSRGVEPCTAMSMLLFDIPEDLSGVYFYFQKTGLEIKAELISVEHSREEIYIGFTGGSLSMPSESKIVKVKRPSNNVDKFEFCYLIKNNSDEVLGYIGKPHKS
jgi:hypothetical protein